jgi:hypothetical protein
MYNKIPIEMKPIETSAKITYVLSLKNCPQQLVHLQHQNPSKGKKTVYLVKK